MQSVHESIVEEAEVRLLLDGLLHCYGFDFREYEPTSLKRRIWEQVHAEGLRTISGLQEKILHDSPSLERLLLSLSVRVSPMFTDCAFYRTFRAAIVPILRTYPSIDIWFPACSTGEEVYALAIVLHEQGLSHRARLYASDLSEAVFRNAKDGRFALRDMAESAVNYRLAGGMGLLSDYYAIEREHAVMLPKLKDNIVFSEHSLATDAGFHEFQTIVCRKTLSSFNDGLRERVHALFVQSLSRFGVLGLGNDDLTAWQMDAHRYEVIGSGWCRKTAVCMEV